MALTYEAIASAVYQQFSSLNDNLDTNTTLVYPFSRVDTSAVDDWVEVWLRDWRELPRGSGNKDMREGRIELRLFAKRTTALYRINLLQNAVDDTFLHAELTVGSSTGGIRVYEPTTRNVTRNFNEVRSDTRAVVKTFEAVAQEY